MRNIHFGSVYHMPWLEYRYALPDGSFTAMASGAALASGIPLNDQFLGTGYHKDLRLWGDFGSQLYLVEQLDENEEDNTK